MVYWRPLRWMMVICPILRWSQKTHDMIFVSKYMELEIYEILCAFFGRCFRYMKKIMKTNQYSEYTPTSNMQPLKILVIIWEEPHHTTVCSIILFYPAWRSIATTKSMTEMTHERWKFTQSCGNVDYFGQNVLFSLLKRDSSIENPNTEELSAFTNTVTRNKWSIRK